MSDFFYYFKGKNRSFLEVFETKGGGEGGSFAVVSKRQNMSDFYFASIPKHVFLLRKGQNTRFFCLSEMYYNRDEKSISLAQSKPQ